MSQFKRGTHCRNGHPYPPGVLPSGRDGFRRCPVCAAAEAERRKAYSRMKWSEGEGRNHIKAIGDEVEQARPERCGGVDMNFTFEKPDWMLEAACRDLPTEWFFPGRGGNTALPKAVCARCPVRKDCLHHSMTVVYGRESEEGPGGSFGVSEKYGIWGGKSENERRDMRRERRGI